MIIISGHQPVYLPWLGLFHKLSLCDKFVYMDTVQYLDGDWNNRNKIKTPNREFLLTVPINKKESKQKNINEIKISNNSENAKEFWQRKHWETIKVNYKKAPFFHHYAEDIEKMYLNTEWKNLVDLCWYQFNYFKSCLGINECEVIRMSEVDFLGKKDELILNQCKKLNGSAVVFGEQGINYVNIEKFNKEKKYIYFQNYNHPTYEQRFNSFVSHMSVLDLLFNCGPESKKILMSNNITKEELDKSKSWYNEF